MSTGLCCSHTANNYLSFDLSLETRLEYLTLAVGNAKSHPISTSENHEAALTFLTDLEEKLEVAQVQLELYHALIPRMSDSEDTAAKIKLLTKALYNISQVTFCGFLWDACIEVQVAKVVSSLRGTFQPAYYQAGHHSRL